MDPMGSGLFLHDFHMTFFPSESGSGFMTHNFGTKETQQVFQASNIGGCQSFWGATGM